MSFLLDQFPPEIFRGIFDHFWADELLYSFHHTSDYLDRLLSNHNRYLVNFKSIHLSQFECVCRFIQPKQVISLILSDHSETPSQSQVFRSLFSIDQFIHLRSLTFHQLDDDGQAFYGDLYQLRELKSLQIDMKIDIPTLQSLPPLERLIINIPEGVHFDLDRSIRTIQFHQLRHLTISNCSCKQLQIIFDQANQLQSLKISLTFFDNKELLAFANFHREKTRLNSLVSLSLRVCGGGHLLMRDDVERFLLPLERLRELELIVSFGSEREFINGKRWESFLTEQLPKLVKFDFQFASSDIGKDVIDQYRTSFWLDRKWFVACSSEDGSSLYTVPHFASTSMCHSIDPIKIHMTTLPFEQHHIFYDCVTQFTLDSDDEIDELSQPYNHVTKLFLNCTAIEENVLDLSQVQSLVIISTDWRLYEIISLIKEEMPAVTSLNLNNMPSSTSFPRLLSSTSLQQIRILVLPEDEHFQMGQSFDWSRLFPCVERLTAVVNSRSGIQCLIHQFKTLISGHFFTPLHHRNRNSKTIRITRPWLEKQLSKTKFIYQVDHRFSFTLSLWIGNDD